MAEEGNEELQKVKKRKKKKAAHEIGIGGLMEERERNPMDVNTDNNTEKVTVDSKKHEEKKKKRESEFKDDSEATSGKSAKGEESTDALKHEEDTELESRKDEKKKKNRKRKGNNDKEDKSYSSPDDKRKRKKGKKDVAADSLELSSEGTSNKGMDAGENITAKMNRATKDKVDEEACGMKGECSNDSKISQSKKRAKKSRRVSFSGEVEVFPPTSDTGDEEHAEESLVQGKRFSPEEDEIVKEAVLMYIKANQLGEEGLHMVLNCKNYPKVKNCWKEIASSLPWRPYSAIYYRAHTLFERSEERKWEPEEYEILRRFHEEHGSNWKKLAEVLGKHRIHVKDAWRRIKLPNLRKGHWSQDEYQALFDLVNLDLRMRAFEEKKTKHGMLRDNICWEAISQKLSTRYVAACCMKWYQQLTSPLVSEGLWVDSDDYRLVDALQKLDACCVEDVDWDNLLEHRSGEICRKRWDRMTRHIGGHQEKSFVEQVEVLSKRYCPEMLEYRT